jgi:hypothetical protein
MPAAFIPFCAFKGDLTTLCEPIGGLNFPACTHFQPTILGGQLCYSLNVSSVVSTAEKKTESGKKKGILIAVDLTNDRIYGGKEEKDSSQFVTLTVQMTRTPSTTSLSTSTLSQGFLTPGLDCTSCQS